MPLYNQPNLTSGIDDALITTVAEVSVFIPFLLVFVFGVVFVGGSISQKRRTGAVDIPLWATLASVITLITALPFTLKTGLINTLTLGIIVTITLLSGFWLFTSQNRNEV